jgi:hypothetical protein
MITGGDDSADVLSIDTLREFAVTRKSSMLSTRWFHGSCYYARYLYAVGGDGPLQKCERYVCDKDVWEALPLIPVACCYPSCAAAWGDLYVLGGADNCGMTYDIIQKLRLDELTWELLELRLPYAATSMPIFQVKDTQVYLVIETTLYAFLPTPKIQQVDTLPNEVYNEHGPCYYSQGTLYCSNGEGAAYSLKISSLE